MTTTFCLSPSKGVYLKAAIWTGFVHLPALTMLMLTPTGAAILAGMGLLVQASIMLGVAMWAGPRKYQLSDSKLIISSGILTTRVQEIYLHRVESVRWTNPKFNFGFDYGTITVSETGIGTLMLTYIPQCWMAYDAIQGNIEALRVAYPEGYYPPASENYR